MSRWLVEKRLFQAAERLKQLRAELKVVDEQLLFLKEAADEARLRALVSETPLADQEHREAQKHAEAMNRHRAQLASTIGDLERSQDELLDRLVEDAR
jgi:chromosome segregation ATPase